MPNGDGKKIWVDGTTYTGAFKDNKQDGHGTKTWGAGQWKNDKYTGDWVNDKRTGFGTYEYADGRKYKGQFLDDAEHGKGQKSWPDGTEYRGEFIANLPHGQGIFSWPDGTHYEGELQRGYFYGKGTKIFADGANYTGSWKNDMQEGFGIFQWKSGSVYAGEWVAGIRTGDGVYIWPDGTRYDGEFQENHENGFGIKHFGKDSGFAGDVYSGSWDHGNISGLGTYISIDGRRRVGKFENGVMTGVGIQTYPQGVNKYIGEWNNNEIEGFGVMYFDEKNEYRFEGAWKAGHKSGNGINYYPLKGAGGQVARFEGRYEHNVRNGCGKDHYPGVYIEAIEGIFENGALVKRCDEPGCCNQEIGEAHHAAEKALQVVEQVREYCRDQPELFVCTPAELVCDC